MLSLLKKSWNYLTALLTGKFNEKTDPKVQLEQALLEAQNQHRQLKEQAAVVIGNQKQTQLQMDRKMDELDKANSSARQAVLMADEATRKGDPAKSTEYTRAAESFANRLIALESEVEGLKNLNLQATQASDQAKSAVQSSSSQLQKKLAERQKLLSQLDQAKMQESMNKTMAQLTETVGGDVPSLDEVRAKIEARHSRALGTAELQGSTVESRMLEVEQASMNTEAQARLSQIKAQLGLGGETIATPAPVAAPAAPTPGTSQPG
jgi:phage shock protein A